MGSQLFKDKVQGGQDRLRDISFSLMIHIGNVSDLILW